MSIQVQSSICMSMCIKFCFVFVSLKLLLQEDNQGVQYEYSMPYSAFAGNHNVTQYTWTHSAWAECSHSCGKGT